MSTTNESLAAYAHDAWSRWMKYLFKNAVKTENGIEIPQHLVDRWMRQMNTQYEDLPENEKPSDRKESEKIMQIFIGE